jgi:uncharacterized repeat protein (TIGR01451 family)
MERTTNIRSRWGWVIVVAGPLFLALLLSDPGAGQAGAAAPLTCVPGPHTGVITGTQEWCAADSPHLLTGDVTVPAGMTLTVEPGVVVMAAQSAELLVQGHLEAVGTPTEPITFTSQVDTGPEQWSGLVFDGGTGRLSHATVRYAGQRNSVSDGVGSWFRSSIAMRNVQSGQVHLENATIGDISTTSQDAGIYVENSHLFMEDSLFTAIGNGSWYQFPDTAIYIAGGDSNVTLANNTFGVGDANTIVLQPGAMMNHDTTLASQNGLVGYVLERAFTVPPGITLTLEPGVTVKGNRDWNQSAELRVEGHLDAIGTLTQPIIFTSYYDTAAGQWPGLVFEGSAGDGTGHMRYVTVRHGGLGNSVQGSYLRGSNVHVEGVTAGEVRLENSVLESVLFWDGWHHGSEHGLCAVDSHVAISNTVISDVGDNGEYEKDTAIMVSGGSVVLVDGSALQANGGSGIMVEGDDAFVRVNGSFIVGNQRDGVRNLGQATVILSGDADSGNAIHDNDGYGANQEDTDGQILAAYNWWGDASGPTHTGNPGGLGEEVTDRVRYEPWLTEVPAETLGLGNLIEAVGPLAVSSGETANLGFIVHDVLTETLENALLVASLPAEAEYLLSSPAGNYWPERQQMVWQLGDIAPGEVVHVAVQVRYAWGLAPHLEMHVRGLVSAANLHNPLIDHDLYAAYESVTVTERVQLSQSELDAELAADSDLNALVDQALAEGFTFFGNAYHVTQSTGATHLEIVLLPDVAHYGETLTVLRMEGWSRVMRSTPEALLIYDLEGGYEFNLETRQHRFWGTWAEHEGSMARCATADGQALNDCVVDETTCLNNCLVQKLGSDALQILVPLYGAISTAGDCAGCAASGFTDPEDCGSCGANLAEELGAEYLSLLNDLQFCAWNCRYSESFREEQVCSESETWCSTSWLQLYGYLPVVMERECDTVNCVWLYLEARKDWCSRGEICIQSPTMPAHCCNPLTDPECPCIGELCDDNPHEILVAGDPNEMYGPMAAAPGETTTYTIACENVGEGTAYGVYIESVLPEGVDEGTLEIGGNGVYYPGTRKLFWNIGELAPSAGDQVTFTVQVATDAVNNTVLVARATVHFPSVPETTPTNDVVTIAGEVVGHGQHVATAEGVATPIALSGWTPTGNPLTYAIVRQPLNGKLSGTMPKLTYTPASGFEGLDSFAFRVSDGVDTSLPAEVTIEVATGAEAMPPEVVFTVPRDGAEHVVIYATPIYAGTYMPVIWAMFNEPIDAGTVTADSFFVTDGQGRRLGGAVVYDGTMKVARFIPSEPLVRGETYTARLTAAVLDTSGNPMAADHVWSFRTAAYQIYLPLVLRGH